MTTPNPTLKGHKLLLLSPAATPPPAAYIDSLRAQFPDLQIAQFTSSWSERYLPDMFPGAEWADTTILSTLTALPTVEQAPKLAYVQLASAGANHIFDAPIFQDTNIAFCTANGVHGPQISEWVILTFLAHQHALPRYLKYQEEQKWNRRYGDAVIDAYQQRIGILGYGSIGRQVARVAKAMGMDVHAYTLHPRPTPESRRDDGWMPAGLGDPDGVFPSRWFAGETTAELHAFLGSGLDLLLIALPLTAMTRGLIGRAEFEVMAAKRTFVSNIARGPIIVTDDLIDALEDHVIRGAALDVTDPEPLPDGHPLWTAKNVIITPHVSGGSSGYYERVQAILKTNLQRLSQGKELINKVNRREGY